MTAPVAVSLDLLDALHNHGELSVDVMLQIYGWHGKHHTAHITALREREGW